MSASRVLIVDTDRTGLGGLTSRLTAIDRAVLLSQDNRVTPTSLRAVLGPMSGAAASGGDLDLPARGIDLDHLERRLIVQALERTGGNQTRAAALLGLNRDQIRYRMAKYGLRRGLVA
jgi:DNA-binding NtrC family response regulator